MKKLFLVMGVVVSLNVQAVDFKISCELISVANPEKKITATVSEFTKDGYGNADSSKSIDGLYWISFEALDIKSKNSGTLSVVLSDENDEVGAFGCNLKKKVDASVICKEPVETEDGKHTYDAVCRLH